MSQTTQADETALAITTHELKVWPEYFNAVRCGAKTFEVRQNDRDFKVGDILHLRQWLPDVKGGLYDGNELKRVISYVLPGGSFGIDSAFCVIGFRFPNPDEGALDVELRAECEKLRSKVAEQAAAAQWHDVPDIRLIDVLQNIDLSLFPSLPANLDKHNHAFSDAVLIECDGEYLVANFIHSPRSNAIYKWTYDGSMAGGGVTRWRAIESNEVSDGN